MPSRTAGRDDADHFVRTIFPIRMNHDYNDNIFNRSDCMPALFPAAYTFDEGNAKGVVENEFCSFEIDTVLFLVDPVLLFIPFKSNHV
jgi:hypothetical protein